MSAKQESEGRTPRAYRRRAKKDVPEILEGKNTDDGATDDMLVVANPEAVLPAGSGLFFLTEFESTVETVAKSQLDVLMAAVAQMVRFVQLEKKAPWNTELADSAIIIGSSGKSLGGFVSRVLNVMGKPEKLTLEERGAAVALLNRVAQRLNNKKNNG